MQELAAMPVLPEGEYVWIMPDATGPAHRTHMPITASAVRAFAAVGRVFGEGTRAVEWTDLRRPW